MIISIEQLNDIFYQGLIQLPNGKYKIDEHYKFFTSYVFLENLNSENIYDIELDRPSLMGAMLGEQSNVYIETGYIDHTDKISIKKGEWVTCEVYHFIDNGDRLRKFIYSHINISFDSDVLLRDFKLNKILNEK